MLAVLDEALARFPDESALHLQRAEVLIADENLDEARAETLRFREDTFHDDPQIEYLEARLALAEGDAQGAAERLVMLAPKLDRATTQFWIGRALEATGDLEGARRRYHLAMKRDPVWSAPATALIGLEQRRGDWPGVVALARKLVTQTSDQIFVWSAMVEALERLGQSETLTAVSK